MKKYIGVFLAIIVFGVQLALLPRTGLTWDEPSSFFFGRANLKFWLTGNRQYLTDLRNPKLFADSPFPYIYGEDTYPPFPFVVSSAFSWVLAEHLHVFPVIVAHHLGEVFLGAVGVWAMYGILSLIGIAVPVAAGTTILYALYPAIFGGMRADAKDIPLMSMLVVFIYCYLHFVRSLSRRGFVKHVRWALITGIALGVAFATKPTAPIILVPLGVWSLFAVRPLKRFIPLALLVGLVGLAVFVFAWPWLWDNPAGKLLQVWQFFRIVGRGMPVQYFGATYQAGINVPLLYPFIILLVQTPIVLIGLGIVGMIVAVRHKYRALFILWFWFGMLRFLVPGMIIYAKVRHFIDVMPAFFILVGFALQKIFSVRKNIFFFITVFLIAQEISIAVTFFPYEPSYFNFLVGGAKHAAEKNLFDVEYWGSTVASAMQWIKNQPGTKVVYACGMKHLAVFYKDASVTVSSTPDTGDFVLVPNAYSWFGGPLNVYMGAGKPVYTIRRAGADLMYIFRITSATWWCGYETDMGYL